MALANTNYIQATIELFGFFVTLIVAVIFWIITANEKKSEKFLFSLLILSGVAMLVDAGWYASDGITSSAAKVINHFCNFAIFICNPCMIFLLTRSNCALFAEKKRKPNKKIVHIIYALNLIDIIITVSNIFVKWVYYIDEMNIYHRMTGWYVYTVVNGLAIVVSFVMLILHRKYLSKGQAIAIGNFLIMPFVGIALQATSLGISFIQIGIALGSVGVVGFYLVAWIKKDLHSSDVSEEKKRLWLIECIFAIMIIFVSAAVISCVISVDRVASKNSEQSTKALAYMVSETVDGALSEPINVSNTMAQSFIIRDALSLNDLEGTNTEKRMLAFMQRIKEEYGYQMVFASSEKTKSYYTYDGLSRYMQVDTDPNDAWYNEFKLQDSDYILNIDEDKDNEMSLAVFVNMGVRDDDGNLLGVCGVGMSIESLVELLAEYEDTYMLDIALTDMRSEVQLDTDKSNIGKKLMYDVGSVLNSEDIYYKKNDTKAVVVKYMDGLDWCLVIDDNNPNKLNIFKIILPGLTIYVFSVLFMIGFSLFYGIQEKKRNNQFRLSRLLYETDRLTGVKNRNAFEEYQKSINKDELVSQSLQVIMMDINGLKTVNDTLGHIAGDELIIGASKCIIESLDNTKEIYRIGGDEFVAIMHEDKDSVQTKVNKLQEMVENWHGDLAKELSISVGFACMEEENVSKFDRLLKIADERMYAEKNAYYRRTGKDRRMSW